MVNGIDRVTIQDSSITVEIQELSAHNLRINNSTKATTQLSYQVAKTSLMLGYKHLSIQGQGAYLRVLVHLRYM